MASRLVPAFDFGRSPFYENNMLFYLEELRQVRERPL